MPRKARLMYRLSSLGVSLRRIHATGKKNGLNERGWSLLRMIYKGISEGWNVFKISFPRAFKHCELIQASF